jgi:thiol-disulfide isomerase/thioredoxin
MAVWLRVLVVTLIAAGLAAPAVAQRSDPGSIVGRIGGSWYGLVDLPERPPRYLEILNVEANGRGGYVARSVFGWGDGSVSLTAAEVTADQTAIVLSLTAPNGARLRVEFPEKGAAAGSYQAAGQPARAIRFERLREAVSYGSLLGVWSARRSGETRVFDVKRVLTVAGGGTVLAVGQLGFAETPDEMRQIVAPVTGEPATAQIAWATAATAVELRRTKAIELTGTFRRTDTGTADKIVFRRAAQPAPEAGTGGEVGQRYPDFKMTAMDGRTVRLSDFRGRVVVVNMFQAWCIWCIEEFSVWRAVAPRYGEKVVVVPVVYGTTSPEWMQQSEKSKRYGVPIYGVEKPPLSFNRLPSSWILDKNGIVLEKLAYQRAHEMFARLDKAVK